MDQYKRDISDAYPQYRQEFDRLDIGLTGLLRGPALTYVGSHLGPAPPQ